MDKQSNVDVVTDEEPVVVIGDAEELTLGGDGFGRENKRRIYG